MGTRGHVRIVTSKGKRVLLFQAEYDAYLSYLGVNLIKELISVIEDMGLDRMREIFEKEEGLTVITHETEPTEEQIQHYREFWYDEYENKKYSKPDYKFNWGHLLGSRRYQKKNINAILKSGICTEYIAPATPEEETNDRIFLSYVYTVDLEQNRLSVQHGYSKDGGLREKIESCSLEVSSLDRLRTMWLWREELARFGRQLKGADDYGDSPGVCLNDKELGELKKALKIRKNLKKNQRFDPCNLPGTSLYMFGLGLGHVEKGFGKYVEKESNSEPDSDSESESESDMDA
jgi:hypothetical protein